MFVLPSLALLGFFVVYPTLWTIRMSFDTGLGLRLKKFVGLENYIRLLTRDQFFLDLSKFPPTGALVNNVIWLLLFTSLTVSLGLIIAVLADRVRYEAVVKAVVFLPMAISFTAAGIIWLFVYSPDANTGLLNAAITAIDPAWKSVAWVGRVETVTYSVILAAVWMWVGFATVVLSAALKSIPQEITEAARVDGATEWSIFWRITLPMLSSPIAVLTTTMVINVLKVFDLIYIMTRGGPRGASRVIAYTMYTETFEAGKGGYGSAVAVIMLLLIVPVMIMNLRRFRAEEAER
ncbi:MAG: sugar ABC transporter permease [Chloroflexi bacterium]|nr:sugar ABC transporter permease [Chloroflexota bacterium]